MFNCLTQGAAYSWTDEAQHVGVRPLTCTDTRFLHALRSRLSEEPPADAGGPLTGRGEWPRLDASRGRRPLAADGLFLRKTLAAALCHA